MPVEAERVVFDCVVYAQAVINPDGPAGRCLQMARDGAITLCISGYVLAEVRELPQKLSPRLRITSAKIEEFIEDLKAFSLHVVDIQNSYVLVRDPDDSHYINLALAANAKLITSRDRDLLDLMDLSRPESREFRDRFPDLRILTPDVLLLHLRPGMDRQP